MKTYIKLEEGVDVEEFESNIQSVVNRFKPMRNDLVLDETITLQRVDKIHLNSDFEASAMFEKSKVKVDTFLAIGLIILIMSWMNFINLTIARGLDRIKESGIRKVLGASRSKIIRQHFQESLGINFMSFVLALSLFQVSLPVLQKFTNIPNSFEDGFMVYLWLSQYLVMIPIFTLQDSW